MLKNPLLTGSVLGFLGVALGAFGAHGLQSTLLANGTAQHWQTAVFYHFVHALALLALSRHEKLPSIIPMLFLAGVLVFSGSLYLLAAFNLRWLGAVTPFGGLALLAGWMRLAAWAVKKNVEL